MDPQTSLTQLPKEIRCQIWALAYFSQPPRLVALRTKPHDENHNPHVFCPRFSPSPAPTVMNICHEARAEAIYQAQKAGHIVRLPVGSIHDPDPEVTEPCYFRFETDILFLDFLGPHTAHHDDYPLNGLFQHFAKSAGADTSALRSIAVTKIGWSSWHNDYIRSGLNRYPSLTHIIMVVPAEADNYPTSKNDIVYAARGCVRAYKSGVLQSTREPPARKHWVDVDFARVDGGSIKIMPKDEWKGWSDLGTDWVRETRLDFSSM